MACLPACMHGAGAAPAAALHTPPACRLAHAQGVESVADVAGPLAAAEAREPWDGGEGAAAGEDEFSLEDLMGDDAPGRKEEL